MTNRQIALLAIVFALTAVTLYSASSVIETLDAGQLMVIQSPIEGRLDWYMTPGIKMQWFGKVTTYQKRDQFWFSAAADQGKAADQSIKVRFNDGGHASISGSVAWENPTDAKLLNALHAKYGSHDAVEQQLVRTIVEKAIYMTGPLMSSKESYAEKRNDLLHLIEDQIQNGVYLTQTEQVEQVDPMTNMKKTVSIVKIVYDKEGIPKRVDKSPLVEFGIRTFNLSINEVSYDGKVEEQIQTQQQAIMQVQIAAAKAKEAEQRAITATKEGEADAMKAKWDQEVKKATAVTEAKQKKEVAETEAAQRLAVAELDAKAAGQFKLAETLRGEGEAARRRLVMEADGALEKKLDAWVKVNGLYAEAVKDHKGAWVPSVVMGTSGQGSQNGAQDLINLFTAKTAKDLALDMSTGRPAPTPEPNK